MSTYKNTTLVILDGNCDEYGEQYKNWTEENHPEITVDYRDNCSGVGGGLFNENGDRIENETLWEDFCFS